jgi:hypothetical protein
MRITLERSPPCAYLIVAEDGDRRLVQIDTDFPGVASSFGWCPCDCGATDGTVDCPHLTANEMIAEAREFLDEHMGCIAEDPGYFF